MATESAREECRIDRKREAGRERQEEGIWCGMGSALWHWWPLTSARGRLALSVCRARAASPRPRPSGCGVTSGNRLRLSCTSPHPASHSASVAHQPPALVLRPWRSGQHALPPPRGVADGATHADPMAQQAVATRGSLWGEDRVTVQGPRRKPMEDNPRSKGHSPRGQNSEPHRRINEAARTGSTAARAVTTRRNLRREDRVTGQGPGREPIPPPPSPCPTNALGPPLVRRTLPFGPFFEDFVVRWMQRGGGGGRGGQRTKCQTGGGGVCLRGPKSGLKFLVPSMNSISCLRKIFLMWVGRWVGGGWTGPQIPPSPSHVVSELWPARAPRAPSGAACPPVPWPVRRTNHMAIRSAVTGMGLQRSFVALPESPGATPEGRRAVDGPTAVGS